MSCNYYRITNYNNVQEGFYRWTGCTGSVNITTILNILDITAEWTSTNPNNDIATEIFVLNKIY
jgi:hypothetical protein